MMNQYGDERRWDCRDAVPPERQAVISWLLADAHPVVLGIAAWNCFRPWQVPERRINDNFFLLVTAGAEQISVGAENRILHCGDAIAVPEYVPHSFGLAPGFETCSHFILHTLWENESRGNLFAQLSSPFLHLSGVEAVREQCVTAVAIRKQYPDGAAKIGASVILSLLIAEAAAGRLNATEPPSVDVRIRTSLQFLRTHFSGAIGVPELADAAHLGEVRFRTLFEQATGMTPAGYLRRTRLLHAARLLVRYDLSVSEITERSGFSRPGYFCDAFRRQFGCTPLEYRRNSALYHNSGQ